MSDELLHQFLMDELTSLRRYALSMTGSIDDADDVIQTTVEKVLVSGLPVESPKAWLVRVCKNVWIDEVRKRSIRNHDEYTEDGEETTRLPQEEATPVVSQIESDEKFAAIAMALDRLTDEHRIILSMVVVEGLSYAQVAESLELPVGTVMSRVARARSNLKKHLVELNGD